MFYNRLAQYPVQVRRQFGRFYSQPHHYLPHFGRLNEIEMPFNTMTPWGWNTQATCCPPADILELDEQYVLEIALPGVVLDDVELKVEENLLTVIAKRTPAMFEERATFLRKELPPGFLVRHFEFESLIIPEQIEARMDRGILYISVPKVDAALRIPVSAGAIENHIVTGRTTRVTPKSESIRTNKEVSVK